MRFMPEPLRRFSPETDVLSTVCLPIHRILFQNELCDDASVLLGSHPIQGYANATVKRPDCLLRPGAALVLDFGVELCGGVKLSLGRFLCDEKSRDKCRLRFRFGESASEVMAELYEKNATNDHSLRDFVEPLGGMSAPLIGRTGFRFLRIDNADESASIALDGVCAAATFRDIEYRGKFISNDEELNRIFDTAAYTLHLCMQEYLWDGIKRDRIVWIGDMYPEISAMCCVFGENEAAEKSLDFARDLTAPDGYINGIYSYSLWWIRVLNRLYMQNGNVSYLKEQKDFLIRLVHQYAADIDENGVLTPNGWAMFDWPSNSDPSLPLSGVHTLLLLAYEEAAFLLRELSDEKEAVFCDEIARRLRACPVPDHDYKQIAAIHVLAGLRDAKAENERVLSKNGDHGISTFLGMFTYAARTLADDTAGALSNVRGVYGGMLKVGATSFWEDFDPAWCENAGRIDEFTPEGLEDIHGDRGAFCYVGFRHSLCHGWSAGVCAYLSEYVLGVKITKPGCREITLAPSLGDLTEVSGVYPTPHGDLEIHCTKAADGKVHTTYRAPEGVKVTLAEA